MRCLWGRNRKEKHDFLRLLPSFSIQTIDDNTLQKLVNKILLEIKAKPGLQWRVQKENAVQKSIEGEIYIMTSITFGQSANIIIKGTV